MSYLHQGRLLRTLKIQGQMITHSRVHIGSGEDSESLFSIADKPIIKINKGGIETPYIPGSSLKGVLRSVCEYLLHLVDEKVCFLEPNSECNRVSKDITNLNIQFINTDEKLVNIINKLCFSCKIFGGNGYSSNIFLLDCLPRKISDSTSGSSPGIAINRRDGTIMRGALFTYEHINPGSIFEFNMRIKNLPNFLIGLIFNAMYLINEGLVLLGGKKRAGLGRIKIILNKIIIESFEVPHSEGPNITIIDYQSINSEEQEFLKIFGIKDDIIQDHNIIIPVSSIKGKSIDQFSTIIINCCREAWKNHVQS